VSELKSPANVKNSNSNSGGSKVIKFKKAVRPNELIINPKPHEIDMVSNPTDYFNIYKNKVGKLCQTRFDEQDDKVFFGYLDKLVNEDYVNGLKFDGIQILSGFITSEGSLTYAKKRNEQEKRW